MKMYRACSFQQLVSDESSSSIGSSSYLALLEAVKKYVIQFVRLGLLDGAYNVALMEDMLQVTVSTTVYSDNIVTGHWVWRFPGCPMLSLCPPGSYTRL